MAVLLGATGLTNLTRAAHRRWLSWQYASTAK